MQSMCVQIINLFKSVICMCAFLTFKPNLKFEISDNFGKKYIGNGR